ncbi:restriction endonuclease subunit S [Citrobacter portucalensis]|nr:restriction endonuclease subunit S [Citrobacter portucalensis]
MAKYKAYSEYKDSGVEWLDFVPIRWSNVPIKYLALGFSSLFLDGDWIESKDISDDGIRYITTGNVGEGHYKEQGSGFITENTFNKLNCTEVLEGDILISRLNNPIGRACLVPCLGYKTVTSVDNVILRADENHNREYLIHLFSSKDYFQHTGNLSRGTTMQRISRGILGNIRLPAPAFSEQFAIAAFLKHETAKIDNLINKQQQLIKLLKEKRQAVISHAVTKGLNPDVPMKDSGVEWLGTIPRNWNCVAIKNICKIVNGSTPKSSIEEYWDGDIDWFTPTDLSHKETIQINDSLRKITNSGFLSCGTTMVPANTVILSSRAPIGSLAITKKSACTNQGCKSLVTFSTQLSKYIYYSLLTFNSPLNNLGRGSTFLELSTDDLGGFKISLPNDDLGEIIKYIDMTILKIDNLIEKQLQQIALLKERRTALISAAVTGKIDVRNWRAPDEQTTAEAEAAQ